MSNENRLTPEAQAALDAVREKLSHAETAHKRVFQCGSIATAFDQDALFAILAALENLDARLKALEDRK